MSFHPNEVQRRGRVASVGVAALLLVLAAAFFRTQVVDYERYALQSETNRLREVPLPAPRGIILDRNGLVIAENIPGYTVSVISQGKDSLRAVLRRLSRIVSLADDQIEAKVKSYLAAPSRPAVVLSDATFEEVSVLEEHRTEFPGLIIQASPKRYYPDGPAVSAVVGYTGQINDRELTQSTYRDYKPGQDIGRAGIERQYESRLRGREGARFVEVDARGRVVRPDGARPDLLPVSAPALKTHLDLELQRFVAKYFADSGLQGGAIAMDPETGGVLALHSAPSFDPNRFIGGIPTGYWRELNSDPRKPLYNKAMQGIYPPASTFKLATAIIALQEKVVTISERMPQSCNGSYQFGSRSWRCWKRDGHGSLTLAQAIEQSCDVYFYQLGLRLSLAKLVAGGIALDFDKLSGIDLPNEQRPIWPYDPVEYFNKRWGPGGWTSAVTLNLSIGQGENAQTILNMARFYTALATDGQAATPNVVRDTVRHERLFALSPQEMQGLRDALAGVVSSRGTAASAQIKGDTIAGKTGTAQNGSPRDHAWFVGFAPKSNPKIVVAVMLEYGAHGYAAARVAARIIERYLHTTTIEPPRVEGDGE
jgi:penicillin-binding protein 2